LAIAAGHTLAGQQGWQPMMRRCGTDLRMFGLVAIGYMWCRMAKPALASKADSSCCKLECARFYMAKIIPETGIFVQHHSRLGIADGHQRRPSER
jgi:hypothetical protein